MVGENSPGVGLDFEVRAGFGVFLEIGEGRFGMVEGGAEGREGFGVERDVKVNAPFGLNWKLAVGSWQ